MLENLKNFSDRVDKISLYAAAFMVLAILFVSLYGAFFRYIIQSPRPWPLPVGRIFMIWSASIGIATSLKRGQHMGVEGFINILPEKWEIIMRYVGYGFVLIFVICLFWFGLWQTVQARDMYMITARTRISYRWLNAAIPVGAMLQLIHLGSVPHLIKEARARDFTEVDVEVDESKLKL